MFSFVVTHTLAPYVTLLSTTVLCVLHKGEILITFEPLTLQPFCGLLEAKSGKRRLRPLLD